MGDSRTVGVNKCSSVPVKLLSQAANSRQCGYLKINKNDFKDHHISKVLKLEETQVSGRVTEILFKDSIAHACLDCHGRPVCILAEWS